MARVLVLHNPTSAWENKRRERRLRFDEHVCPTVMQDRCGLAGDTASHYWIEDDGTPEVTTATEKPPYRIPLMTEIAALEPNGLDVVSTFSGCGGSCLGFRMAGYRTLYAAEFVDAAAETYRANHPGVHVDQRDIREITGDDIRRIIDSDTVDVLEGSPPCASFSTAGKRSSHWGEVKKYSDREQRTDDLFFEYARLVGDLKPRAFVAENVAGLVKGVAKGYFKRIHQALVDQGYRVEARLLDAQWLGVPQARSRVIFVGIRRDLKLDPRFPDPLPYRYTIRDALPWIDGFTSDGHGWYDGEQVDADAPAPTIPATRDGAAYYGHDVRISARQHGFSRTGEIDPDAPAPTVATAPSKGSYDGHEIVVEVGAGGTYGTEAWRGVDEPVGTIGASPSTGNGRSPSGVIRVRKIAHGDHADDNEAATLEGYAVGREWDKLQPGEKSDRYLNLVRAHPDEPCPTVTAQGTGATSGAPGGVASVTHPSEKRKFTIAELRRLCGFPDDFVLTGTYAQQWERLGRAVPPPMMAAVARAVAETLS